MEGEAGLAGLAEGDAGDDITTVLYPCAELRQRVLAVAPEALVVRTRTLSSQLLADIGAINRNETFPTVYVGAESRDTALRAAARAGITAYAPSGGDAAQTRAALRWSAAQSSFVRDLMTRLQRAETKLADRGLTERAKGLIMKQKGMSEEEAYALLRETAMRRSASISSVARSVVDAAQLLG